MNEVLEYLWSYSSRGPRTFLIWDVVQETLQVKARTYRIIIIVARVHDFHNTNKNGLSCSPFIGISKPRQHCLLSRVCYGQMTLLYSLPTRSGLRLCWSADMITPLLTFHFYNPLAQVLYHQPGRKPVWTAYKLTKEANLIRLRKWHPLCPSPCTLSKLLEHLLTAKKENFNINTRPFTEISINFYVVHHAKLN